MGDRVEQEQELPDFRITGSVPPKVLPEAHRFAPRIRSPRSRKLPLASVMTPPLSSTPFLLRLFPSE